MLNYAIIGFGSLGKNHFNCSKEVIKLAGDVSLVALCDIEESRFSSQTESNLGENTADLDLSAYNLYTDVEEMLKKEKLDFVVTALPTYLHEKIAVQVMEHGVHVFSEKPMAINLAQAENMIVKAKENNVKLMIGQCLRFWNVYVKLKELIDSEEYGKVISADFSRLSQTPLWSWQDWMLDGEKSGGAILDLHVHDVDYIHYVFGMPKSVTSVATNVKTPHDSIQTVYNYGDDRVITASANWGFPTSYGFRADFTVRFEKATVDLKDGNFNVYPEDGEAQIIELKESDAYVNEVVEFIKCIREDRVSEINPPEASLGSIKIALAERESADTGKTVEL